MSTRLSLRTTCIAATLAVLGVVGCGSGDPEEAGAGAAGASTTTSSTASTVTTLAPGAAPTTAAPAQQPVTTAPPTGSGEPAPTTAPAPPVQEGPAEESGLFPPPGQYTYAVTGYSESGVGGLRERREAPPEQVAAVVTSVEGDLTRIQATTTASDGSSSRLDLEATATAVFLVELAITDDNGVQQRVRPDPRILVARLPYQEGDTWDLSWRDNTYGIQGVGTGHVVRRESVETGAGPVDTYVIELRQRIRGTIQGEMNTTTWVDPTTGVYARLASTTALGLRYTETDSVLRSTAS